MPDEDRVRPAEPGLKGFGTVCGLVPGMLANPGGLALLSIGRISSVVNKVLNYYNCLFPYGPTFFRLTRISLRMSEATSAPPAAAGDPETTFEQVAQWDLEFRTTAAEKLFDLEAEGKALIAMLSSASITARMEATLVRRSSSSHRPVAAAATSPVGIPPWLPIVGCIDLVLEDLGGGDLVPLQRPTSPTPRQLPHRSHASHAARRWLSAVRLLTPSPPHPHRTRLWAQGEARWDAVATVWAGWKVYCCEGGADGAAPDAGAGAAAGPGPDEKVAALGAAVQEVVTSLDALHLQPTGMYQRIQDGIDATAFGVSTLMSKISPAPAITTDVAS